MGSARARVVAAIVVMVASCLAGAHGAATAAPADLDLTFGTGGALTFSVVPGEDRVESIAMQPDGKIVVAGASFDPVTQWDFVLARFNPDGTPDTTFSGDGWLTFDVTGGHVNDRASAVAVQPDGGIVVVGFTIAGPNDVFAIARFLSDGTIDGGFGGSGPGYSVAWFPPLPSHQRANAVSLQSDGKIVVAGHTNASGDADFALVRLMPDGSLDGGFGSGGKVSHPVGGSTDEVHDIAIQPDGRIVAVGETDGPLTSTDIAVARYNTDGSLDTTFNFVGVQTTAITTDTDAATGVVVQPDGKIVVAGETGDGSGLSRIALVRYGPGGGLDTGFGTGGVAVSDFSPYATRAFDIALQNNDKLVVVGDYYRDTPPVQDFLVAQYDSAGVLDTSFDGDGVLTHAFVAPAGDYAQAVAVQPDGKIVVGGAALVDSNYDLALMRLAGELPIVPSTPAATITSPSGERIRSRKLKSFEGEAGPAGEVATVEIALRRIDRKLLKRGRCLWLRDAEARFVKTEAANQTCSEPHFLAASGTERWSYRLEKRLARGAYELYVRVTLTNGATHTEFSEAAGNRRTFKVT